ncbi:MAG: exo-alpha-sialidase [Candidatus Omnitrophica bacterium]|nr:exo-alpha-sialidase [Candidatus Omnitrophota bacterium]
MSIFHFIFSVSLVAATFVLAESDAQPAQKSEPDVIVYSGDYPGWPWVCRGADGTLYCVFREGTVHMYSANGRAMFAKSTDGGRTWSEVRAIADEPNVDDRNVAIAELPNGDLLVNFNTFTEDHVSQAMFTRSSDGGETWSEPRALPVPNSRTRASAKALANGWILIPLYLDPDRGAVAAISKDNGETWEGIRIPNAEGFVGDEWDLIEPEPGHLIGLSRNDFEDPDRFVYLFESHDSGMTWETPKKTNIQTGRHPAPVQVFFQNGAPTVIYPDERMVSISAIHTTDPEYLDWNLDDSLPCYVYNEDRSPVPDGSYAVSASVGENERFIVDYEIREESRRVTGYFVEFPKGWGKE